MSSFATANQQIFWYNIDSRYNFSICDYGESGGVCGGKGCGGHGLPF